MRVGFGYDVHLLAEGRRLVLGGVEIAFSRGLLGHSDADVLLHAVCDAVLGAIGEGDIGKHFPDNDSRFEGISSLKLLAQVSSIMQEKNFALNNLDATIVAQSPKLSPYFLKMEENISRVLSLDKERVNIKATTTEGMGITGKGEAMAAYAIASVTSVCL